MSGVELVTLLALWLTPLVAPPHVVLVLTPEAPAWSALVDRAIRAQLADMEVDYDVRALPEWPASLKGQLDFARTLTVTPKTLVIWVEGDSTSSILYLGDMARERIVVRHLEPGTHGAGLAESVALIVRAAARALALGQVVNGDVPPTPPLPVAIVPELEVTPPPMVPEPEPSPFTLGALVGYAARRSTAGWRARQGPYVGLETGYDSVRLRLGYAYEWQQQYRQSPLTLTIQQHDIEVAAAYALPLGDATVLLGAAGLLSRATQSSTAAAPNLSTTGTRGRWASAWGPTLEGRVQILGPVWCYVRTAGFLEMRGWRAVIRGTSEETAYNPPKFAPQASVGLGLDG